MDPCYKIVALVALSLLWTASTASRALASETEVREFAIHVNGKQAGQCLMTITKDKDGTETMSSQANVKVKILVQNYTFALQGVEVWKNGRLWQLQNSVDDNGKKTEVSAVTEDANLRIRVNGREQLGRGDVWTNSYWKLAEAKYYNKQVSVLEADSGKELSRQLHYIGVEPVTLGGKQQSCYHFRLTGGPSPVDLWYDGDRRLVRQEFTEDGHRMLLHLSGLRRSAK